MLTLEEMETPGFGEIVDRARESIQDIYPEWTNYNPADSGMALLELFAYMTEAQQFHLEQMGHSHQLAFLNLLGMQPEGLQAARVFARAEGIEEAFWLAKGTKVLVDTLVYEAEQSLYVEKEHVLWDEGGLSFYPFGENPEDGAYYDIRLQYELDGEMVHTLYFDLADTYPVSRNPVARNEFIPFVEVQLQYYDGERYQFCDIISDSTFGLLQTGMLQFRLNGRMGKLETEYRLRLKTVGEYDTAPLLKGIYFNMLPFVQRDTKMECREYTLQIEGMEFYEVIADSWLAVNADTVVYVREEKGFRQLRGFSSYVQEEKRHFVFDGEVFRGISGMVTICLISKLSGLSREAFIFYGNGLPEQQFYLPDEGVQGSCFRVWVEEDRNQGYYIPWSQVPDFARVGKAERVFVLDEEKGILRFGNGRQGIMPKGKIRIVSYATCAGSRGNVQKNQMFGLDRKKHAVRLHNPLPASGGRNPETVDACLERYKEKSREKNRAVTREDYEEIIKKASGLRIKKVKVFPSDIEENSLEVVVQPFTNGQRILRKNIYDRNIIRLLEKKKMLGTQILVKSPEYIGISIRLEVAVKSRYFQVEEKLEEHIKRYFEENMDFGKTVVYSRVFGFVDTLPETAGVRALDIHAGGKGVIRDNNRDIHVPSHGMAYLENMQIRCILMDEV